MKLFDWFYRLGDRRRGTVAVPEERRTKHYRLKEADAMMRASIERMTETLGRRDEK